MAIDIDACAAAGALVVTTHSSVYELVVTGDDREHVLVRGGTNFAQTTRVVLMGSLADDGSLERGTIRVGLRMMFVSGSRVVVTSPVQSVSCRADDGAAAEPVSVH